MRVLTTAAGLSAAGSILILDTLACREPGTSTDRSKERFCPNDLPSLLDKAGWTVRTQNTIADAIRACGGIGRLPATLPAHDQPRTVFYLLVVADLAGASWP